MAGMALAAQSRTHAGRTCTINAMNFGQNYIKRYSNRPQMTISSVLHSIFYEKKCKLVSHPQQQMTENGKRSFCTAAAVIVEPLSSHRGMGRTNDSQRLLAVIFLEEANGNKYYSHTHGHAHAVHQIEREKKDEEKRRNNG